MAPQQLRHSENRHGAPRGGTLRNNTSRTTLFGVPASKNKMKLINGEFLKLMTRQRNETLRAFVSNPLWSVCVEAKASDGMTHTCSVPSGSSSTTRYPTRAQPSDLSESSVSATFCCLPLCLHEAPFTFPTLCLTTHEFFMPRLPNG